MKLISSFTIFLIVVISGIKAAALSDVVPAFKDEPADLTDETATSPAETSDFSSEDTTFKDEKDETDVTTNDLEEVPKETEEENDTVAPRRVRYANVWYKPLNFGCPRGKTLTFIQSVHSNQREDRIFGLECNSPKRHFRNAWWIKDFSEYQKPFTYACPTTYVITGLYSRHSNKFKDRIWLIRCSKLQIRLLNRKSCYWTNFTQLDAKWAVEATKGKFITGMRSYFNYQKEDRRFSFKICTFFQIFYDKESDKTNNENKA